MPPISVFGIGQTELLILGILCSLVVVPVIVVGVVIALVAGRRGRDDRRE